MPLEPVYRERCTKDEDYNSNFKLYNMDIRADMVYF